MVERMLEVLVGRAHKIYSTDSFRDKFYRMRWDEPSRTIVAHRQKDGNSFIHPSLDGSCLQALRKCRSPPPIVGNFLVEALATAIGLVNDRVAQMIQPAG